MTDRKFPGLPMDQVKPFGVGPIRSTTTTTTRETFDLTHEQIQDALVEYVRARATRIGQDAECRASVKVRNDSSWEAEGKDMFLATVTLETVEVQP